MAKVIEETQRPALILAPNKTLAAQLYGEFKSFFPDNAVEYFVSYYDYYQPEAYVPRSDTFIEKESSINEQNRPDAALGDPGAAGARRRHHRRVGVVHLRHRLGRDLHGDVVHGSASARRSSSASSSPTSWRCNTSASRRFRPRHLPGPRRRDRAVAGPPGGSRLGASACSATRSRRSASSIPSPARPSTSSSSSRSTPTATTSRRARHSSRRSRASRTS